MKATVKYDIANTDYDAKIQAFFDGIKQWFKLLSGDFNKTEQSIINSISTHGLGYVLDDDKGYIKEWWHKCKNFRYNMSLWCDDIAKNPRAYIRTAQKSDIPTRYDVFWLFNHCKYFSGRNKPEDENVRGRYDLALTAVVTNALLSIRDFYEKGNDKEKLELLKSINKFQQVLASATRKYKKLKDWEQA